MRIGTACIAVTVERVVTADSEQLFCKRASVPYEVKLGSRKNLSFYPGVGQAGKHSWKNK